MEKVGSGWFVMQLLTLAYGAAVTATGSGVRVGWDVLLAPSVFHQHRGDPRDQQTREQHRGTLVWVGASSIMGCMFWGATHCHCCSCRVAGMGLCWGCSRRGRWCVDNAALN